MKISTEVLTVLSQLEITGNRVVIAEQLDRKLYPKVNQVLEACGGKWNRKAKAHLFEGDASIRIDLAIVTGDVVVPKNDLSFFPTPPALARQLVEMAAVEPDDFVLEPSAGSGRIVDAVLDVEAAVFAVERDKAMRDALRARASDRLHVLATDDFMNITSSADLGGPLDAAVMNPPFAKIGAGDHLDHVQRAYNLIRIDGRLVAVLPVSIEYRQDRRHVAFRKWYTDLGGYVDPLPEDTFKESGTSVRTCVLLMKVR